MKTIKTLDSRIFRHLCMTIGELPTNYLESMTYYEMVAWLCEYIKKNVVTAINDHALAIKEIQDWIENLDLQDEVDDKIDRMKESGELAEIITQYLEIHGILAFDSVADMKSAENLIDGSFVETYGYYSKNDGGSAKYKVREVTNQDTVDGMFIIALDNEDLVAELILGNKLHTKQLGAHADGINDDTEILQSIINASSEKGGVIHLDDGTYKITDSLTIPHQITIEGDCQTGFYEETFSDTRGAVIVQNTSNKSIFKFPSNANIYQCYFEKFRITAKSGTTGCIGFDFSSSGTGIVSEFVLNEIQANGNFDIAFKFGYSSINTMTNCIISANNVGIELGNNCVGLWIERCNLWYNDTAILAKGETRGVNIHNTQIESTKENSLALHIQAPATFRNCCIDNTDFLFNDSEYAIYIDGVTNPTGSISTNQTVIKNSHIQCKTGIKIDMDGNTGTSNSLQYTYLEHVKFVNCTDYGIDSNFENTFFELDNCNCYSNFWYGAGTLVNRNVYTLIKETSTYQGLNVNSTLNFSHVFPGWYSKNSLYLDQYNRLNWRFEDTSKTATVGLVRSGSTANRPASSLCVVGDLYYDTTLGKPIWWNGSNWKDATGATV